MFEASDTPGRSEQETHHGKPCALLVIPRATLQIDDASFRELRLDGDARSSSAPAESHHLEVAGREACEGGVQLAVIPAVVHSAGDVHVTPVVGHDQTVGLHRPENVLDVAGIARQTL